MWISHVFIVEMQVSSWVRGGFWGGFGVVDLGVVSVTMEVQVEAADDVTKGEEVADEKKGAED